MGKALCFKRYFLAFLVVTCVVCSSLAHAQNKKNRYKKFTNDNVREFIQDSTAITSVSNVQLDQRKVEQYLERHIDKDARFKTTITYIVPGMPEQEKTLSLNKQDYIAQVAEGANSVEHYHSDIDVQDVDISKNKKTASATTVSFETGIMEVPNPDGTVDSVPIEGRSECFQVLKLSKKGYIQMYSANCTTRMEFLPN